MNSDIDHIKEVLSCVAQMNGIGFQIWGTRGGMLYSSEATPCWPDQQGEIRDLACRIFDGRQFMASEDARSNRLWGVPLFGDTVELCCLIAFEKTAGHRLKGRAQADHDRSAEELLHGFKRLIEEDLSTREVTDKLTEELDRSYEDLYLFSRIATQIKTLRFSDGMLRELVRELLETMRADVASAHLTERPQDSVLVSKPGAADSVVDMDAFVRRLLVEAPAYARTFDEGCFIVRDSREINAFRGMIAYPYRFLAVPIQQEEKAYGSLVLVSFNMREIFRRSEYRLLRSMAEQVALVMANSDLYQDLEGFVINMVRALVQAIEAKDVYTRGHSERVCQYSTMIGKALGLDGKSMGDLHWASTLHDIGKIGTPEHILNKTGRLTDEEYDIIKTHSSRGAQILSPVEQLRDSMPGILSHHERYDGKGYPQGLKGEEIPLMARIIAVADTFDAITSNRAYRSAAGHDRALSIVEEVAGSQLDADIAAAFLHVMRQKTPLPVDATLRITAAGLSGSGAHHD